MELFLQQLANGLVIGSTYAVVAIGFSLVFTVLRVVNFAHPEIFMIGMFAGLAVGRFFSTDPFIVALASVLGASIAALVLERLVIRPLRGRDVLSTLIATLGAAIVVQNAMAIVAGPDPVPYPTVLASKPVGIGPVVLTTLQLTNLLLCVAMLAAVSLYVRRTKFGRATRAIAERPDMAAIFGVNVNLVCLLSIIIASALAGVAGVSVGMLYGSAWAFVGTLYGLKAFVCMLVAGNRVFEGVMIVALTLGVIESMVTSYVSSSLKDVVAFFVLIGILMFRPSGVFGSYALPKA